MNDIPVSSLGIRFGKYLDPMIDTKLRVVAHETIDYPKAGKLTDEDDVFYLFKLQEDDKYYCCYIPIEPSNSGPKSTPDMMRDWLENSLGLEDVSPELLKPKSADWFQDFYLAEVRFTDTSSKLVH